MKLATKILLGYLAVTSLLLHVAFIGIAVWMVPVLREGWKMANDFQHAQLGQAANKAIIKDVSELKDGEHTYTGYALEYQGKPLYAAGVGQEFKVGEEVAVTIQKHPYAPLKTMIVMVMKNGRWDEVGRGDPARGDRKPDSPAAQPPEK